MKPAAFFVNTVQKELKEKGGLIEAFKKGKISGVALDTFTDKLLNSPIAEIDKVIITPHIGVHTLKANIK